jgi:hypothetical protein
MNLHVIDSGAIRERENVDSFDFLVVGIIEALRDFDPSYVAHDFGLDVRVLERKTLDVDDISIDDPELPAKNVRGIG